MLTLEQIEASRQVNKQGTEANRLAKAHGERLNAWNSKFFFLRFLSFLTLSPLDNILNRPN
jgi:hypothetical protein